MNRSVANTLRAYMRSLDRLEELRGVRDGSRESNHSVILNGSESSGERGTVTSGWPTRLIADITASGWPL